MTTLQRRGGVVVAAVVLLGALGASAAKAGDATRAVASARASFSEPSAGDAALEADRQALLRRAEAALARGDSAAAAATFEQAAGLLHSPDTEMGQVRTAMQQGRYRQALAFSAHTAGAHLESAPAGALYAWLLRVGGQVHLSDRVLAQTLARLPDDPVALATQRAFAGPWPQPGGPLLEAPHRVAPYAVDAAAGDEAARRVADDARVVSSGVLIDGGRRALVPLASVSAFTTATVDATGASPVSASASAAPLAARLWLRNGLGQSTKAVVEAAGDAPARAVRRTLAGLGVAVLRLDTALPCDAAGDAPARHDPFAGSPGFVVEYAAGDQATVPAWPWLRQGFLGGLAGNGTRLLGIDLPGGPHGGLVLDARGRVAGLSLPGPQGVASFVPASLWRLLDDSGDDRVAPSPSVARPASPGGLAVPADAAYERGLRLALQVLVEPL